MDTLDQNAMMSISLAIVQTGPSRVYQHSAKINDYMSISWSVEIPSPTGNGLMLALPILYGAVEYRGDPAWFGIGFNSAPMMLGTDAIVFEPLSGTKVRQWVLTAKKGSMRAGNPSTLISLESKVYMGSGRYIGTFARPLAAGSYEGARALSIDANTFVFAHGKKGEMTMGAHEGSNAGMGTLHLAKGTYTSTSTTVIKLHGIVMFICWAILAPAGIFAARFFKHAKPNTGPSARWFVVHKYVQSATGVLLLIGFGLGVYVSGTGSHFKEPHGAIGLTVFLLGILQPINAYFRPPKMPATSRRTIWELVHKVGGYGGTVLAIANIYTGILMLGSPILIIIYSVFVGICTLSYTGFAAGIIQKCLSIGPAPKRPMTQTASDAGASVPPVSPALNNPLPGHVNTTNPIN